MPRSLHPSPSTPPRVEGDVAPLAWSSHVGRLQGPTALRLARGGARAWALCAPDDASSPPRLVCWNPRTHRAAWRLALSHGAAFDLCPDERTLLVAEVSGLCALLDADTGAERARFRDAPGPVSHVALARGRALVLREGTARVYDLDAQSLVAALPGHGPAALDPEGATLAVASAARDRLTLYAVDRRAARVVTGPRGRALSAMAFADDGLLVGWDDGTAAALDPDRRAPRPLATVSRAPVTALRADGARVAVGHADGALRRIEPARVDDHHGEGPVAAIDASLDGALHREARAAILVDLDARARHDPRDGHRDTVTAIAVARDGRRCVTASRDGTLRVWDVATGATELVLEGHEGPVVAAAMSPDGRGLWSSGERDGLRRWCLVDGLELAHIEVPRGARELVACPSGARMLARVPTARGRGATTALLDTETGRVVARGAHGRSELAPMAFDATGRVAVLDAEALADGGLALHRVDARTGDPLEPLALRPAPRPGARARPLLRCVAGDGAVVSLESDRAGLRLHDLVDGAVRATRAFGADLLATGLARVGGRLVASATGGRIDVCRVTDGARWVLRLPSGSDRVTALATAPDDGWVLAGTAAGALYRYALPTA